MIDAQADRKAIIRERPELRSAFVSLRAAQEYAEMNYKDRSERERFIRGVQEVIAGSIYRGEPLPDIRIREREAQTTKTAPKPPRREREEPTR